MAKIFPHLPAVSSAKGKKGYMKYSEINKMTTPTLVQKRREDGFAKWYYMILLSAYSPIPMVQWEGSEKGYTYMFMSNSGWV